MIRLFEGDLTVPAGTPIAAPVSQAVQLADAHLVKARILVPDGHSGLTGLRITWSGTQIFPYNTGTWFTSNDEILDWDFDYEITAGGLALAGYNTDVYPHTFYVRFYLGPRVTNLLAGVQSGQLDQSATAAVTAEVSQLAVVTVPATDVTAIEAEAPVTP